MKDSTIINAMEKTERSDNGEENSPLALLSEKNNAEYPLHPEVSRSLMKHAEFREARQLSELRIIHPEMREREVLDSFRDLQTNLLQRIPSENFILMVTGVRRGSGSSFVARNLAAAFALDETRTAVLVDCDLRYPSQHELAPEASKGIIEYIEGKSDFSEIIYDTGVKRLRLVPCVGKRECFSEYFSFPKMGEFFSHLKNRYPDRYLIVDAPSACESADIRMLSSMVDYVLLVAPYGKVTKNILKKATDLIPEEKLAGVVVNNEPV